MIRTIILLSKNELIEFYKYGRIFAYGPQVTFQKEIEQIKKDNTIPETLSNRSNAFDYSIDAFILYIESEGIIKGKEIPIKSVKGIYALDADSYNIGLDLSPAINILEPLWPNAFNDFQVKLAYQDSEIGIHNTSQIFKVDLNIRDKKFITKKEKIELHHDLIYDIPVSGKHSLWYYLLRYERHQNYPKDFRGYLLDSIHAYINFKNQHYIDESLTKSQLCAEIMNLKDNIFYKDIVLFIHNQSSCNKEIMEIEKKSKQFLEISVLFLLLKDNFINGFMNGEVYKSHTLLEFAPLITKNYDPISVKYALYLLGMTLGRNLTYKYMYEYNKLPILKTND